MTHEELLFEVDNDITYANGLSEPGLKALRAVLKMHYPTYEKVLNSEDYRLECHECDREYPCMTTQAIEKELG
jgi:hypothetical protein